jgi:hypothetical protein
MTVGDFIIAAKNGDEFGCLGDDGLVHGYVVREQTNEFGDYMFNILSALCNDAMFHREHAPNEIATVNCMRCLARENDPRKSW